MLEGIKSTIEKWLEHAQEAISTTEPSSDLKLDKVDHLSSSMKFVTILSDRVHVISASPERDEIFTKLRVVAEECVQYTQRSMVHNGLSAAEFFRLANDGSNQSEDRVFMALSDAVKILM
jgi:hypothetical protein